MKLMGMKLMGMKLNVMNLIILVLAVLGAVYLVNMVKSKVIKEHASCGNHDKEDKKM